MADWAGNPRYFWGNEMNQEADWDFDALNEIDWWVQRGETETQAVENRLTLESRTVWDDLAPAVDPVPPPPNAAPSSHERNISSSRDTPFSPAHERLESPPAREGSAPPSDNLPAMPPHDRRVTAPLHQYRPPPPPSLEQTQHHSRQAATSHEERRPIPSFPLHFEQLTGSHRDLFNHDSSFEIEDGQGSSLQAHADDFETLSSSSSSEGEEEEKEEEKMPSSSTTRRPQNTAGAVVDLTLDSPPRDAEGSSSRYPRPCKRSAPTDSPPQAKAKKRSKPSATSSQPSTSTPHSPPQIDSFDLTNETTTAEEEVRRAQQQALIASQQAAAAGEGPVPIGQHQCIICLEPFTDVTITHCGHIYCHECLTQALNAGEKNGERGVGTCPVCRKQVRRSKQNQMIVVNFMKKEAFRGKARRIGEVYS